MLSLTCPSSLFKEGIDKTKVFVGKRLNRPINHPNLNPKNNLRNRRS